MDFTKFPTTAYAEALSREDFVAGHIRPLWQAMPRIAGPAFTVRCPAGDHLMLHAAIYQAQPGDVIVVDASDNDFATAGGNVCAIAQERGIAGFVIDGYIRDLNEVTTAQFPVYARGVVPVAAKKRDDIPNNQPIRCGGARVCAGDMVIADEDGIIVLPQNKQAEYYHIAQQRHEKDAATSLADWQASHYEKIRSLVDGL